MAAFGKLASAVAHDLRNALGVINNSIYFLNMKWKGDDEKINRHLEILRHEIERSGKTIDNLLEYSKADSLTLVPTDINKVLKERLAVLDIPEGITIETVLDDTAPAAPGEIEQLRRVFENIILNAIQAMPDGGNLRVTTRVNDGFLETNITDTGVGIQENDLGKIFEPFYTSRAAGIGLGLAIVKEIVERHGGDVAVSSSPGKGASFSVTLPVASGQGNS